MPLTFAIMWTHTRFSSARSNWTPNHFVPCFCNSADQEPSSMHKSLVTSTCKHDLTSLSDKTPSLVTTLSSSTCHVTESLLPSTITSQGCSSNHPVTQTTPMLKEAPLGCETVNKSTQCTMTKADEGYLAHSMEATTQPQPTQGVATEYASTSALKLQTSAVNIVPLLMPSLHVTSTSVEHIKDSESFSVMQLDTSLISKTVASISPTVCVSSMSIKTPTSTLVFSQPTMEQPLITYDQLMSTFTLHSVFTPSISPNQAVADNTPAILSFMSSTSSQTTDTSNITVVTSSPGLVMTSSDNTDHNMHTSDLPCGSHVTTLPSSQNSTSFFHTAGRTSSTPLTTTLLGAFKMAAGSRKRRRRAHDAPALSITKLFKKPCRDNFIKTTEDTSPSSSLLEHLTHSTSSKKNSQYFYFQIVTYCH